MIEKALPYTSNELIQENIFRLKQRLRTVFSNPNPYNNALWEKSEIEQWIKKLNKLIKS